jgi:hypothetical protein
MADWNKVKIYYDNRLRDTGSTLLATSTESTSDFSKDYISNWLETNAWQAEDSAMATTQDLTLDLGVGNTATCDYLTIYNHNLNTAGVTIVLQYSTDNFSGDTNDAFTAEAVSADTVYHKEFSAPSAVRYWRIRLTGVTGDAPYIRVASFGIATELDYASTSYDPYQESIKQNVSMTEGGRIAGIHKKYTERNFSIQFTDADSTLYNKAKTFFDTHEGMQFFIGWETGSNPDEIWLVRNSEDHNSPLQDNGVYRSVTLDVKGRKE